MGMTAKQVMKVLKANGWVNTRIVDSHYVFEKVGSNRPITVPFHGNKDLGVFAKTILKEAGITEVEDDISLRHKQAG